MSLVCISLDNSVKARCSLSFIYLSKKNITITYRCICDAAVIRIIKLD